MGVPSLCAHIQAHLFVMASLCCGSSLGRYMMIPTQLKTESTGRLLLLQPPPAAASRPAAAGLMTLLLAAVQRCSMGAGAGTSAASMMRSSSCMYAMSLWGWQMDTHVHCQHVVIRVHCSGNDYSSSCM